MPDNDRPPAGPDGVPASPEGSGLRPAVPLRSAPLFLSRLRRWAGKPPSPPSCGVPQGKGGLAGVHEPLPPARMHRRVGVPPAEHAAGRLLPSGVALLLALLRRAGGSAPCPAGNPPPPPGSRTLPPPPIPPPPQNAVGIARMARYTPRVVPVYQGGNCNTLQGAFHGHL